MDEWMASALHISKDIRAEMETLFKSGEIEDLLISYLDREASDLKEQNILLIGSGDIGHGIVERLLAKHGNINCTWLYHQHKPEPGNGLREKIRIEQLRVLKERLKEADIVISAVNTSNYIIREEHFSCFNPGRKPKLLDLSIPRSIDPELNNVDEEFEILDLDDFKYDRYQQTTALLTQARDISRTVIHDHRGMYEKLTGFSSEPTDYPGTNVTMKNPTLSETPGKIDLVPPKLHRDQDV